MKLIVGLGNPGREYASTRHNVGWWAVDHLARAWHLGDWKKAGQSLSVSGHVAGESVRIIKPQTYMNLSGNALVMYRRRPTFTAATDLLVIVDEVALPVGRLRMRAKGSAGGHNGLKSIEAQVGSQDYARLRIGIRPAEPERDIDDLADFVLAPFGRAEAATVEASFGQMREGMDAWLSESIEAAMNICNKIRPAE